MKTVRKISGLFLMIAILILPVVALAEKGLGLVQCESNCQWNELLAMINGIIKFILFDLAVPIAAIMFFYAGFLLITAGGEAAHARTKAKGIFLNTVIGLIIAIAAWLIISTILFILGYDGSWIGLQIKK